MMRDRDAGSQPSPAPLDRSPSDGSQPDRQGERDRLDRAEAIFWQALDAAPADRAAIITERCGDDAQLRAQVVRLLQMDAEPETRVLPSPSVWIDSDPLQPGEEINGRYRLLEPIGEGGLGVVWRAEQFAPVTRQVAIKFVRHELSGRHVVARFALERVALSLMNHPAICRIFDAGVLDDDRPYVVMELVTGDAITVACDRRRSSIDERIALFAEVCRAVHHAHQKGILHRDLKPSNVLVAEVDGRPTPRVIDFGIAKALHVEGAARLAPETLLTRVGQFVGTPAYMAPEQMTTDAAHVDVRADIYALGVILHELLAGCLPFDAPSNASPSPLFQTPSGASRSPRTPSVSVRRLAGDLATRISRLRGESPRSLRHRLRGELDWIVARAMATEPDRRYASASELAADLDRFLADEPVLAGPESVRYRLRKFVVRNTAMVAAGAVLGLAVTLGLVGTTIGMLRANAAHALERVARDEADRAREASVAAADRSARQSYRALITAADAAITVGEIGTARAMLDSTDPALRAWEWHHLRQRVDQSIDVIRPGRGQTLGVALTPDERTLLVTSGDGSITEWELATGRLVRTVSTGLSNARRLAVSPTGDRVAVAGFRGREAVAAESLLLSWPDGPVLQRGGGTAPAAAGGTEGQEFTLELAERRWRRGEGDATICGDGAIAARCETGEAVIELIDLHRGASLGSLHGHAQPITGGCLSRDRRRLYTASEDGTVRVWSLPPPAAKWRVPETDGGKRVGAALGPDGRLLASGGWGTLQLWSTGTGELLWSRELGSRYLESLAFSPKGHWLAVAETDGRVLLISVASGSVAGELPSCAAGNTALAWDPLDRWLVLAGADGALRLIDPTDGALVREIAVFDGPIRALALAPDGSMYAAGAGGTLLAGDSWATLITREPAAPAVAIGPLDVAASPPLAAGGISSNDVHRPGSRSDPRSFAVPAREPLVVPWPAGISALCFDPTRSWLLVGDDTGRLTATRPSASGTMSSAAATRSFETPLEIVRSWQIAVDPRDPSPEALRSPLDNVDVAGVAMSGDGRRIAVGLRSGLIGAIDPAGDGVLLRAEVEGRTHALAFTADAALVVGSTVPMTVFDGTRQPEDVTRRRAVIAEARRIVDPLFATLGLREDVLAELDASAAGASESDGVDPDAVLDEFDLDVRQEARRFAEARGESITMLVNDALYLARMGSIETSMHRHALRWIEHAIAERPEHAGRFQRVRALLLHRVGDHDAAALALARHRRETEGEGATPSLAVLATHILIEHARGNHPEARSQIDRLRERLDAGEPLDGDAQWLVPEASELIRRPEPRAPARGPEQSAPAPVLTDRPGWRIDRVGGAVPLEGRRVSFRTACWRARLGAAPAGAGAAP